MDLILNDLIILIGIIFKFTVHLIGRSVCLSLPDFDNAISRGGDYKALGGLESRNISNNVMVTHRQGFWAPAGRVLSGSALLFTVDLLVRLKGDGSEEQLNINMQKIRWK